jgi:hypothetical protein
MRQCQSRLRNNPKNKLAIKTKTSKLKSLNLFVSRRQCGINIRGLQKAEKELH